MVPGKITKKSESALFSETIGQWFNIVSEEFLQDKQQTFSGLSLTSVSGIDHSYAHLFIFH